MLKRKLISTGLAFLGLSILFVAVLYFLGLFKEQESGILVESEPIAVVFIDGKEVGKTPYEANLKPSEINLKIKPEEQDGVVLDDYETKINLIPGVRTIVKRTFNPSEDYVSGVLVSFEKVGGVSSYVTVVSAPDGAKVTIDNKLYGYAPIKIEIPAGDHTLVVSSDGYKEESLPIKVYKGYKLTGYVKLAKDQGENIKLPEPTASPEPTAVVKRIKINKTDIGYLKVREGANTGFPIIGQVKPAEVYEVIEEGEHGKWYKIKFTNPEGQETEGWVSAEFVTKISP